MKRKKNLSCWNEDFEGGKVYTLKKYAFFCKIESKWLYLH